MPRFLRRARWLLVLPLALTVAASPLSPNDGAPRPIRETDLYRFTWIADPRISPDGQRVVYVQVTANAKRDGYETSLWMAATSGRESPRRFTSGPRDASPAWSPDGQRIAFLRAPEKDGKPQPSQIYLIDLAGGEARPLTEMKKGAGAPVWSPDGKTIAFTTSVSIEDAAEQRKKDEPTPAKAPSDSVRVADTTSRGEDAEPEGKSDVRVITRATYRFNGAGWLDHSSHDHIWTVPVNASGSVAKAKQITFGEYDESAPVWSPDGSRLYFTSTRIPEPEYVPGDADLYSVPAAGGEMTRVVDIDGFIGDFAVSPDGKRIAFIGTANPERPRSYDQSDLFVVEATPGATARNLTTGYDFDIGGGLAGDQRAPRGRQPAEPVWTADGRSIIVRAAAQGRANLRLVSAATGAVSPLVDGDHEVVSYTATPNASRLAMLLSSQTVIGELHTAAVPANARRLPVQPAQLTRVNAELFSQLDLGAIEEFWYPSFDGMRIHGWIQKPPGFDPSRKYPMILQIHGGPHAAYGHTFYHEMLWMAAKGYVVLYTNPRGSSSYGQEFGNVIQYNYPGDDYKDLMVAVDTLLGRGYIDEKRLGVTGGSGGGILTNWTITKTDRFAAAVSQRSIADWTSFWFTADFAQFTPFWFRKAPWQDPKEFDERSPISFVEEIDTPLMLVEGDADYRTPPGAGGELMFRALKFLKKPVVMVRFPDESHDLSRSGKPRHRVERLRHIVAWFDKYLLGKTVEGYAVE
jgi:dipeptidyl aminopeptidase/acylaminoacyl peptidase